jgi:hypothetical protein
MSASASPEAASGSSPNPKIKTQNYLPRVFAAFHHPVRLGNLGQWKNPEDHNFDSARLQQGPNVLT